ncbi:MAG: type II secretion system F family protein [Candidatus Microthrix parvicella]
MSAVTTIAVGWLGWAAWASTSMNAAASSTNSARHLGWAEGAPGLPGVIEGEQQSREPAGGLDRRSRIALVLGGVALLVHPVLALVVVAWWGKGRLARRRVRLAHVAARRAAVPEVADLFVVALSAGLTVRGAILGVAEVVSGPLSDDLRMAGRGLAQGDSIRRVLDQWSESEHPLEPIGAALAAADRSGSAATPLLARCADQQRELARRRAEALVRRLPVRLLGPLVLCILPALMAATFGPLAIVSFRQLGDAVP